MSVNLALIFGTVIVGLVVRFAPLGLPHFISKYGGSTLWALMIYWLVSTLLPRGSIFRVAVISVALATAVEFLKLYHCQSLDAFRLTLPGILLLGRIFSGWDIVAYWLAIGAGAFLDGRIRPRRNPAVRAD